MPKRYEVKNLDLSFTHTKLLLSVLQAPILELKPLPDHLKYVYLGGGNTLPIIITKDLTSM